MLRRSNKRAERGKHMSLRQIANELGISPAYLSYMVNGKRPWRRDLYDQYRQLVNTSVNNVDRGSHGGQYLMDRISQLRASFGGSGRESNPPTPCLTRHNGFEVRKSHRAPSTPNPWTMQPSKAPNPTRNQSSFSAFPWVQHQLSGRPAGLP